MLKPIPSDQADVCEPAPSDDALMLGLDILEYLVVAKTPKGVSDIARYLAVPRLQVFRAVKTLARLGYLAGGTGRGTYVATSRLYELGINAPFIQRLMERAKPVMRSLSEDARQSCNLAVPFGRHLAVVQQTPSSGAFSINVPIGFRYLNPSSAPAVACLAMTRTPVQAQSVLDGVTDLSCAIFDGDCVTAVLTVPYVRTVESLPVDRCLKALQQAAATLSAEQTASVSRLTVLYG